MTRQLLNHVPSIGLAVIFLGTAFLIGLAGHFVVGRFWPSLQQGESNDLAGVMLGVLVGVYGIVLAFVIVALWDDFRASESSVIAEATSVSLFEREAAAFDAPARAEIDHATHDYLHSVVEQEWPLMRDGKESAGASAKLEAMYAALRDVHPEGVVQETFYDHAASALEGVVSNRRDRLHKVTNELPGALEILMLGGAVLIIGFTCCFGTPNRRVHLLMITAVAMLIGFNLLVAVLLDHPFSGDVAISYHAFQTGALSRFWP